MREKMLEFISREIENARAGKEARIFLKQNSLVDPMIISALYEASDAGVNIDLIIRGICCLVPGVQGLSENIRVISIVGRYLEHSRFFYFYNEGKEDIYLSSADMMQRNLDRRVEIAWPVEDPRLKNELMKTLIKMSLKDNVQARMLNSDMSYTSIPVSDNGKRVNSQEWLMNHSIKAGGVYTKIKNSE